MSPRQFPEDGLGVVVVHVPVTEPLVGAHEEVTAELRELSEGQPLVGVGVKLVQGPRSCGEFRVCLGGIVVGEICLVKSNFTKNYLTLSRRSLPNDNDENLPIEKSSLVDCQTRSQVEEEGEPGDDASCGAPKRHLALGKRPSRLTRMNSRE